MVRQAPTYNESKPKKVQIMRKNIFLTAFLLVSFTTQAYAQDGRVGVNTNTPTSTLDVSGKKDAFGNLLTSDITGIQAPRLTLTELNAKGTALYGTNQKGTLVYITSATAAEITAAAANTQTPNITDTGYYFFDGSLWQKVGSGASNFWKTSGNTGTSATTNFIGTTDNVDFVTKTNNTERTRVTNTGKVLIGATTVPTGGTNSRLIVNNGTTNGALQIKDGTEANGRVLTSDANGVATWQDKAPKTIVESTWLLNNATAATNNSIPVSRYNSIAKLTLTEVGTYSVYISGDYGLIDTGTCNTGAVELLVTTKQYSNNTDLSGGRAIPGTWNTLYNAIKNGMGSFTITNSFILNITQATDIYLTLNPILFTSGGCTPGASPRLQRWGNEAEAQPYNNLTGGLSIDGFRAYKF